NYPNPFNPQTTIQYSILQESKVELNIYNIKGQKVKQLINDQLSAGQHLVVWDGMDTNDKQVSSGIYFYKLEAGDYQKVRKMVLVK
ncbi:MAG: T9SS type A sorting domain-containing protein, partial [Candidatus Cloacimonetes bacterium]|nr:T9SS type A sorting domain-containing protein [Candidatus Cloacimonadota bacterium]